MSGRIYRIRVHTLNGVSFKEFCLQRLVIAGWTGRNESAVRAHIQELEAIGVRAPIDTPSYYPVTRDALTSAEAIEVVGSDTSGEVECVIFIDDDDMYVTVGSDHTDRKLEAISVSQSKQICGKPVSMDAWPMSELRDHWDQLRLESWTGKEFDLSYQRGAVSGLRNPEDLLHIYQSRGGQIDPGTVMFCGTLPVIGEIRYGEALQLRLVDPVLGREIRHCYQTTILPIMG